MKKIIFKKIWFAVFALFLVGSSIEVNAQSQKSQVMATQFGVTAYDYGTFEPTATSNVLAPAAESETDLVKREYLKLVVFYYMEDQGLLPEDALVISLQFLKDRQNLSNSALQTLYADAINLIQ